jgi:hypothetical protein
LFARLRRYRRVNATVQTVLLPVSLACFLWNKHGRFSSLGSGIGAPSVAA